MTPSQVQEPGQTPVPPRARRRRRGRLAPPLVFIVVIGVAAIAGAFMLARAFEDDRPRGPYLIGAWTFGDAGSLERAVDAGALDEVSLDWLQSRADGSVAAPRFDAGFLALVREKDCRVVVTLTDYDETIHTFDPRISAEILATAQTRRAHAEAVAEWCRANDVDGLDVDWEALKATQRGRFTAFVAELARQLHDDGRFIAVDVYPKLREPGGWDGPRAQDWSALGEVVDQVRVMTYNYSGSWSGPGPLSPPAWMDAVLTFAESQIASRKVVMGIGFYGRDWRGSRDHGPGVGQRAPDPRRLPPQDVARTLRRADARLQARRRRAHRLLPRRQGDRRQADHDAHAAPAHPRGVLLDAGAGGPRRVEGPPQAAPLRRGARSGSG